jgi:PAS domain S-box-containing protein
LNEFQLIPSSPTNRLQNVPKPFWRGREESPLSLTSISGDIVFDQTHWLIHQVSEVFLELTNYPLDSVLDQPLENIIGLEAFSHIKGLIEKHDEAIQSKPFQLSLLQNSTPMEFTATLEAHQRLLYLSITPNAEVTKAPLQPFTFLTPLQEPPLDAKVPLNSFSTKFEIPAEDSASSHPTNTSHLLMFRTNERGEVDDWNENVTTLLGFSTSIQGNQQWLNLVGIHLHFQAFHQQIFELFDRSVYDFMFETQVITPTRENRTISWQAHILKQGNTFNGVIFCGYDLTEQQRFQEDWLLKERSLFFTKNGVTISDVRLPDNPLVYVNPAFTEITGYTSQEALGKNCRFLQGNESDQPGLQVFRQALSQGTSCNVVLKNFKKNGEMFWNELKVSPIYDEEGRLTHFIGIQNDITAYIEKEAQLAKNKERLKLALEAAQDGLWDWNIETGEVYYSDQYAKILDYEASELAPNVSTFFKLLHPEDAQKVNDEIKIHFESQSVHFLVEFRMRSKKGAWKWILSKGKVVSWNAENKPIRMIGTHSDITDRKEAEAFLNLLEVSINSVSESMLWIDPNGKIINANHHASIQYGYTKEELINSSIFDLKSDPSIETWEKNWKRLQENGVNIRETLHKNKNGITFPVEFKSHMVHYNGQPINCAIINDLTERLMVEKALKDREIMEATHKLKSKFFATVSHEMRTPLYGILGLSQLVLDTPLSPEQKEYLEGINTSGEGLLTIINDILDVSKMEAGKFKLNPVSIQLRPLLEEVCKIIYPMIQEKGLSFSMALQEEIPTQLWVDPVRIKQILFNLLSNAVKFTNQGSIRLCAGVQEYLKTEDISTDLGSTPESLSLQQRYIFIRVEDTGIGIPVEKTHLIFSEFEQIDDALTRKYSGTGLGLAICNKLIDQMEGSLSCQSTVGKGSTFEMRLPLDKLLSPVVEKNKVSQKDGEIFKPPITTSNQIKTPNQSDTQDIRSLKILLVEDVLINRTIIMRSLEKRGHQIDIALNGLEAIEAFQSNHYDLILMDIQMPELNGLDATRRIRALEKSREASGSHIPIIALSAQALPEDLIACKEAGMDDYLSKPFKAESLYKLIDTLISP